MKQNQKVSEIKSTVQKGVISAVHPLYLSLLKVREWTTSGTFCLRVHRWRVSSEHTDTRKPWKYPKTWQSILHHIVLHWKFHRLTSSPTRKYMTIFQKITTQIECWYFWHVVYHSTAAVPSFLEKIHFCRIVFWPIFLCWMKYISIMSFPTIPNI